MEETFQAVDRRAPRRLAAAQVDTPHSGQPCAQALWVLPTRRGPV
ncbi:hypothetical protein PKCBPO_00796 [Methylorubrum thiocyanatum]